MVKYLVKNYIRVVNREAAVLFIHLKSNTLFLAVTVVVILLSIVVGSQATDVQLVDLLDQATTAIFGLLSVFITAAIFLATLSRQATSKSSDVNAELMTSIIAADNVFRDAYTLISPDTPPEIRWRLVVAHAAESIHDQATYRKFRIWLITVRPDFAGTIFEPQMHYSYDVASNAVAGRSWSIKEGLTLLENDIEQSEALSHYVNVVHKQTVIKLKSAISNYELSGVSNLHEQAPFVGSRLSRVTFYGIAAIGLIFAFKVIVQKEYDYYPWANLRSHAVFVFLVLVFVTATLALYIRYLALFVAYLRQGSSYYYPSTRPFYLESPAESNGSQFQVGYMGMNYHGR